MSDLRNIKLTVQFDGTGYCGWLYQKHCSTVQGVISDSIKAMTGNTPEIFGCSRTDSGVHAVEYVLNFYDASSVPIDKYPIALNSFLPEDIICKKAELVTESFHATYSVSKKTYRYYLYSSKQPVPFFNNRAWFIGSNISVTDEELCALNNDLKELCGKHDFSAFRAVGGISKTTIRTIFNISISKSDFFSSEVFCVEVTGDGFLYNMVRIIAGTVADVIKGRINSNSIKIILDSCDRRKAGPTAPAHGLYLWSVEYL